MFKQFHPHKVMMIASTFLLILLGFSFHATQAQECDRDCLEGMITQYIDALAAHKPSRLPLADNVRFTEDSKVSKIRRIIC